MGCRVMEYSCRGYLGTAAAAAAAIVRGAVEFEAYVCGMQMTRIRSCTIPVRAPSALHCSERVVSIDTGVYMGINHYWWSVT
jgi:hypothetical protein